MKTIKQKIKYLEIWKDKFHIRGKIYFTNKILYWSFVWWPRLHHIGQPRWRIGPSFHFSNYTEWDRQHRQ